MSCVYHVAGCRAGAGDTRQLESVCCATVSAGTTGDTRHRYETEGRPTLIRELGPARETASQVTQTSQGTHQSTDSLSGFVLWRGLLSSEIQHLPLG